MFRQYSQRGFTSTLAGVFVVSILSASAAAQIVCEPLPEPTFSVFLPKVGLPPDDEGQGWDRPPVWEHHPNAVDETIEIPNGRPIYALIVSGFGSNKHLDELMVYNFARHLQAQGAYVHYAWWNNLLAPYMERPLHHNQSHPGGVSAEGLGDFLTAEEASHKAVPGEDYQLVADANRLLNAIRENNPSAMIIVVGHSMGGGSVVHIGEQADVLIDILAPFDPTNNRNYPWLTPLAEIDAKVYNWTRWRVTRHKFLGFKSIVWQGFQDGCQPDGPWLKDLSETANSAICGGPFVAAYHNASTLVFSPKIANLYHGWQNEFLFPFDYDENYVFSHNVPPNGTTHQAAIPVKTCFDLCSDPGGWPNTFSLDSQCCQSGAGVGWPADGHGEIVGYRGPLITGGPVPLGVRVRTSPECGECPNLTWPARSENDNGVWSNGNGAARKALMQEMENLPLNHNWQHKPKNPNLCLVSGGLIQTFNNMNKPPAALAGEDQTVECAGQDGTVVYLDGSGSTDPDLDTLEYRWDWSAGTVFGAVTSVTLPKGTHCFSLTVRDPTGHIDRDIVTVIVQDTTPPELTVTLSKQLLWPPNHTMKNIQATVEAVDLCGTVEDLTLVSIVSNQPDDANGIGDGTTIDDIQGVTEGVLDTTFKLRAERGGQMGDRIYTVTYQATDDSGNRGEVSVDVIVPKSWNSYQNWLQILN